MAITLKNRSPRNGEEDEGEERHHNPFLSSQSPTPKIQFRKEVSKLCWDDELGMGEVLEKKGSMWATTGIVRAGKLYCHIEEIIFLAERGALVLSGRDGMILSLKDIYTKIAEGTGWDSFEVYRHLKSLGYVVGHHGIPWTMKSELSSFNSKPLRRTCVNNASRIVEETVCITQQFEGMQISEMKPTFDVYLPNSKFRKCSPGEPSFLLCLLREKPPLRIEVESLENKCKGVPLKYCFVDHGRVSFFSCEKVMLPVLP